MTTARPPNPGSARDRTRGMWLLCGGLLLIGCVSALLAFWRSAHAVETVLGIACLPVGALAQMVSQHTNQRWMAIVGVIGGGFGLALGVAHGGV